MNPSTRLPRFSWLLVCIIGTLLSAALFHYLQGIGQRTIDQEITQRSEVKLQAIRAILQQHLDATQMYMSFVRSELKTRGFIKDDEAEDFTRGILAVHRGELQTAILLPPQGMGAPIMINQGGNVTPVSLSDIKLPPLSGRSGLAMALLDQHLLRIVVAEPVNRSTVYVVCDWNLKALIQHAIVATPTAGLNIRLVMDTADKPVTVFYHQSRVSHGELPDNHVWQKSFSFQDVRFTLHTQALPALINRISGFGNLWALAAGLMITALLTLLTFNHIRINEVLSRKVETRTRQLSGERAKLAAVIDHAHDAIMVVDQQGRILRSNPAADAMFRYSDLVRDGLTVHDLVPTDLREQHEQWFESEVSGITHRIIGQVRELRGQKSNGDVFPCEVTIYAFTAGNERQFSVVLRDLTALKQSQWVQKTLLRLRVISQAHSPLHERLKEMLEVMLSSPWPIAANAIYTVQGDQLWLTASQGWQGDEKKRHLMIPVGHCLCGEPIREQHLPCKPVAPDHDVPGSVALSVLHEEHQLGLLYLQLAASNMMPKAFTDFARQAHEIVAVTLVRERIRQTLEDSESKHRQLIETTPVGIIIQTDGVVQFANPAALSMLGSDVADSVLQHEMAHLIHTEDRNSFSELIAILQQGGHIEPTELRLQRLDGSLFWAELRGVPVVYESNPSVQLLIQDISDRRQAEDQLTLLSYTDELTKLPNRRLYIDRLEQACSMAARRSRQLCLLFMDLDRFKIINDTQGHACGDRVLKLVADRILETLRASDTAARMGGDEFAVLLPETDPASALRVANKLSRALKQPMLLSNQEFSIGVSIGLAAYPDDGRESDTLLNHADSAMYYAKQHRLDVHCFSGDMEQAARRRMVLERELTHAAERQQLQLYYQTQFRLEDDGEFVSGVESLLRWHHPELGMVSPAEFIPIAEEAGLIRPLTAWVIGEASRQARLWQQQGRYLGRIGINVSALELMQVGLAEDILGHIREAGAEPEWFEIEITETAVMSQPDTAIVIMQQLVDSGVSMAIDDFGTGYSSLAYLKRLPAHHLKIDIAFIRHLPDDAEDVVIVRTIIAMAHALGLRVIAEGVETAAQLAFLRREGCDMVQGYLLGKPLPADQVTPLLPDHPA